MFQSTAEMITQLSMHVRELGRYLRQAFPARVSNRGFFYAVLACHHIFFGLLIGFGDTAPPPTGLVAPSVAMALYVPLTRVGAFLFFVSGGLLVVLAKSESKKSSVPTLVNFFVDWGILIGATAYAAFYQIDAPAFVAAIIPSLAVVGMETGRSFTLSRIPFYRSKAQIAVVVLIVAVVFVFSPPGSSQLPEQEQRTIKDRLVTLAIDRQTNLMKKLKYRKYVIARQQQATFTVFGRKAIAFIPGLANTETGVEIQRRIGRRDWNEVVDKLVLFGARDSVEWEQSLQEIALSHPGVYVLLSDPKNSFARIEERDVLLLFRDTVLEHRILLFDTSTRQLDSVVISARLGQLRPNVMSLLILACLLLWRLWSVERWRRVTVAAIPSVLLAVLVNQISYSSVWWLGVAIFCIAPITLVWPVIRGRIIDRENYTRGPNNPRLALFLGILYLIPDVAGGRWITISAVVIFLASSVVECGALFLRIPYLRTIAQKYLGVEKWYLEHREWQEKGFSVWPRIASTPDGWKLESPGDLALVVDWIVASVPLSIALAIVSLLGSTFGSMLLSSIIGIAMLPSVIIGVTVGAILETVLLQCALAVFLVRPVTQTRLARLSDVEREKRLQRLNRMLAVKKMADQSSSLPLKRTANTPRSRLDLFVTASLILAGFLPWIDLNVVGQYLELPMWIHLPRGLLTGFQLLILQAELHPVVQGSIAIVLLSALVTIICLFFRASTVVEAHRTTRGEQLNYLIKKIHFLVTVGYAMGRSCLAVAGSLAVFIAMILVLIVPWSQGIPPFLGGGFLLSVIVAVPLALWPFRDPVQCVTIVVRSMAMLGVIGLFAIAMYAHSNEDYIKNNIADSALGFGDGEYARLTGAVLLKALAVRMDKLENLAPKGMVYVGGGAFISGNQGNIFYDDPLRPGRKSGEWRNAGPVFIDKTEVTIDDYRRYLKQLGRTEQDAGYSSSFLRTEKLSHTSETKSSRDGAERESSETLVSDGRLPVTNVSWTEASNYCQSNGKRLPTADEWEKAARGASGRYWPWGNSPPRSAWTNARTEDPPSIDKSLAEAPAAVGSHPMDRSFYGALDMAGNVSEWVTMRGDAKAATRGLNWVLRFEREFAGWPVPNEILTVADKQTYLDVSPDSSEKWIGFRCARDATGLEKSIRQMDPIAVFIEEVLRFIRGSEK